MKLLRALSVMVATALVTAVPATGTAHAANLLTNPGFETGSLSGWTCSGTTGSAVTNPVRTGTYALAGRDPRQLLDVLPI